MYEALRQGATVEQLHAKTFIKPWFIQQMKELVDLEQEILHTADAPFPTNCSSAPRKTDSPTNTSANASGIPETDLRNRRIALGIVENWDAIPVSGVDQAAYYYSTYNAPNRVPTSSRKKIMVLGGGPNRIGQGIEFDYCCVHAALALREAGYETIMVNCNPETVSTDYDTSDKLYFEPLTAEDVLAIYEKETRRRGRPVRRSNPAEPRQRTRRRRRPHPRHQPGHHRSRRRPRPLPPHHGSHGHSDAGIRHGGQPRKALEVARRIGYPVMVRPSYVLGGRGMEVVYDEDMLRQYVAAAVDVTPERPILIDRFLENAIEAEADALADGTDAFVPAIMEHIELAGIHSGDSACAIPPSPSPPATSRPSRITPCASAANSRSSGS
jgi:carbamoyl-phosphate synthase large subunit